MEKKNLKLQYIEANVEISVSEMPDILTTSGNETPGWGSNTDQGGWT